MSLNREELARFLAERLGDNFNEEELDDELLGRFTNPENVDNEDVDDIDDEEIDNEDVDGEEEEFDGLEDIDVTQLSATERMLYNTIMAERRRAKKSQIDTLISTSGLSAKFIPSLKRLASSGVDIKEIKASIEEFKQIDKSASRVLDGGKFVPKSKIKKSTDKAKDKVPTKGYDLGKHLAELKNKGKRK